jgi:hypothetical protein
MKKTYINPNLEVVKLNIHQHLLEGSPVVQMNATNAESSGMAREYDFFEED